MDEGQELRILILFRLLPQIGHDSFFILCDEKTHKCFYFRNMHVQTSVYLLGIKYLVKRRENHIGQCTTGGGHACGTKVETLIIIFKNL